MCRMPPDAIRFCNSTFSKPFIGIGAEGAPTAFKHHILTSVVSPVLLRFCAHARLLALRPTAYALGPGDHIHPIFVKLVHASRKVTNIEFVLEANFEIINFEHEPVHVAFGVGIDLHQQIIFLGVVDVD